MWWSLLFRKLPKAQHSCRHTFTASVISPFAVPRSMAPWFWVSSHAPAVGGQSFCFFLVLQVLAVPFFWNSTQHPGREMGLRVRPAPSLNLIQLAMVIGPRRSDSQWKDQSESFPEINYRGCEVKDDEQQLHQPRAAAPSYHGTKEAI